MREIIFTKHAEGKFETLRKHALIIARHRVLKTVTDPERLDLSRAPLIIAQRDFDKRHVLRVVYKQQGNVIKIITFYPGRKSQYEKEK